MDEILNLSQFLRVFLPTLDDDSGIIALIFPMKTYAVTPHRDGFNKGSRYRFDGLL